jgi:polyhydroxybutyrate depolymerase
VPAVSRGARLERDQVVTPPKVALASPHPLVVFLHGLGDTGGNFERSLDVPGLAQRRGFSFVVPDGAADHDGRRFWNAGAACCDFEHLGPNHVEQIASIPTAVQEAGAARFDAFVIVGFSNGAFMANRLACDVPRVTGIVAIAGSIPGSTDRPCKPAHPVRVIVIHGDSDEVVPYAGGGVLSDPARVVASAPQAAKAWAELDGCSGPLRATVRRDLVEAIDGKETRIEAYQGCKAPVELWTVEGAGHLAVVSPSLVAAAVERILAK